VALLFAMTHLLDSLFAFFLVSLCFLILQGLLKRSLLSSLSHAAAAHQCAFARIHTRPRCRLAKIVINDCEALQTLQSGGVNAVIAIDSHCSLSIPIQMTNPLFNLCPEFLAILF